MMEQPGRLLKNLVAVIRAPRRPVLVLMDPSSTTQHFHPTPAAEVLASPLSVPAKMGQHSHLERGGLGGAELRTEL